MQERGFTIIVIATNVKQTCQFSILLFVSHTCEVNCDVSTASCKSSSGQKVNWLCATLQSTMLLCNWLVFNSCDWSTWILAVPVSCSLGCPLSYSSPAVVSLSVFLYAKPSVISKEKKHLSSILVSNGYPFPFLQNIIPRAEN